jgi:PKD repeat protein
VSFAELSTGAPTFWAWDFGDGATSSEREPTHVYAAPGTYAVSLRAANGAGEDTRTRVGYVNVGAPPPVRTFLPVADARVNEASPSSNTGLDSVLRVKAQSGSSYQTYLRFDVGALPANLLSAKLRLWCTDASTSGGSVFPVTNDTWGEATLTWNNRPAFSTPAHASFGAVGAGAWSELELGPAAVTSGLVSFAVAGGNTNSAYYSSREGAHSPELVLTFDQAPSAPVAAFSGAPLSGPAPLAVGFVDASSGSPSAWSWDFGDGTGASVASPTHVYDTPGTYTVTLSVANSAGTDELTRNAYVVVGPPVPVRTFFPTADARVNEASPGSNAGTDIVLRVRQAAGGSYHTYLRFDLSSLTGTVVAAKLRLFASDGSDVAGRVFKTSGSWTESSITWTNKPAPTSALVTSLGTVANLAWAEFDVLAALTGAGQLDLVLQSSSTNSAYYSSREGANPPELVITTSSP